jgi:hypothetical protein
VVVGAVRRRAAQAVMVLVLAGIVAAYTVVNWPQRWRQRRPQRWPRAR